MDREGVQVPGTVNLWLAPDGRLVRRSGKPAALLRKGTGKKPSVEVTMEDGTRRVIRAEKLAEAARTGVPLEPTRKAGTAEEYRLRKGRGNRAYAQRQLAAMEADPADPHHGTLRGYQLGCRCSRCSNASKAEYRKEKVRRTLREAGVNPYTGGPL